MAFGADHGCSNDVGWAVGAWTSGWLFAMMALSKRGYALTPQVNCMDSVGVEIYDRKM